jgi:hypothetical protein
MTKRDNLWEDNPIPVYPVREYFNDPSDEEKETLTRLFVENRYMRFFPAVNRQMELELFFGAWTTPEAVDEIMGNILISFYRDQAVHFTINLFSPSGALLDEKRFVLAFGQRASEEDLPYLAALVKTGKLAVNLFRPTAEGVDILARYNLSMDKESLEELYTIVAGDPGTDTTAGRGELLYASDLMEESPFPKNVPAYEIPPGKNIKAADLVAGGGQKYESGMIFSGVREGKNYIMTDIPLPPGLEDTVPSRELPLKSFIYNLDYIIRNGQLFRVYNDARFMTLHKYSRYQDGDTETAEMLDVIQSVNIAHENNKMDYQIMKESFLTEEERMKKVFFAMDLMLFPFFRDMGPVMDYLLSVPLDELFLKKIARRISGGYEDIFNHYAEGYQSKDARRTYRLEKIVRYLLLFQTMEKLLWLAGEPEEGGRQSLEDAATSALVEYHRDFLEELFSGEEGAVEAVLSLITPGSYQRLFRDLQDSDKMGSDEAELKAMDVKEALTQGLKEAPWEGVRQTLFQLLKDLFYGEEEM